MTIGEALKELHVRVTTPAPYVDPYNEQGFLKRPEQKLSDGYFPAAKPNDLAEDLYNWQDHTCEKD